MIARPDMAPQNFNLRLQLSERQLFELSENLPEMSNIFFLL
jgi:hypothetical protein